MVDMEPHVMVAHLRRQLQALRSLVRYLEARGMVDSADHAHVQGKVREVIEQLKAMERFTAQRGATHRLRLSAAPKAAQAEAHWAQAPRAS